MKVVPFLPRQVPATGAWQTAELQSFLDACAAPISRGEISGWEVGETETGDAQLYLLGPAPDHDCVLCVSRVGQHYVLEDGAGRVLYEHDVFRILSEQVRGALQRKKAAIVSRIVVAWLAIKETFEEKIEPALAEPMEVLSHVAPQIVALV